MKSKDEGEQEGMKTSEKLFFNFVFTWGYWGVISSFRSMFRLLGLFIPPPPSSNTYILESLGLDSQPEQTPVLTPSMTRGHKVHTTDPTSVTTLATQHVTATGKHKHIISKWFTSIQSRVLSWFQNKWRKRSRHFPPLDQNPHWGSAGESTTTGGKFRMLHRCYNTLQFCITV